MTEPIYQRLAGAICCECRSRRNPFASRCQKVRGHPGPHDWATESSALVLRLDSPDEAPADADSCPEPFVR